VQHVLSQTATTIRTYDFNWMIAVLLVYGVLLLIGALRKRWRGTLLSATLALVVVAAVLLLFTQIGIKETSIYG
jgi:uncharacterized membrane protein (DUF2068 family)